uniref:uncharacterized protein LOC120346535 n=1 Tax=Styela clava TaxID=7725 RepID=UPI00193A55CE|nr:uncharacterized protein LOC120346535 [Styela clava]
MVFLLNAWKEGSKYPSKRDSSDLVRLDALNIREVILEFNYTFAASDSGDVANQTFCLGIVYPANCNNYYGPHSVECLGTIWLSAKCLEEGSKYPEKRDGAELVRLDELDLRFGSFAIFEYILSCNCTNYYGPHSIDCLKTIWLSAKCLEEGSKYPSKRDSSDLERLDALNIREVILEFNYTFAASDSGDVANQTFVWNGTQRSKYPSKRDPSDLVRLDALNIREVVLEFNYTFATADNGDVSNQTFCLGIVYPTNCINYYGPHSVECLETIWLSAKCLEEGSKYPEKRDEAELVRLDELDLRQVIDEFNQTFIAADNGDSDNQTFCLGIVYPANCTNYYGPHSIDCLKTIWLSAKCLEEGIKYPEKRDSADLARLDDLNIREIILEFNYTFATADSGDVSNQTFCLGIVYPTDCNNYYGPHSVECLETIWLSAKCLEEGSKYPEKRDEAGLVRLDELNLRQVIDEFNETFISADNGDSDNQTFCLGIAYPVNCTNYYGPHSIDCLKTIWLSAKCLEEGSKYPSKRDSSDLERLDALNIREVILEFNYTFAASDSGDVANQTFCLGIGTQQVIDEFNQTFIAADNGDSDNQTFCLGIVYPADCTNYYGPHSIDCLKTIWLSAKCLEEGSKYPEKRDSADLARLDALNIREMILEFNYTFATADSGDVSNQTFCLGIVYPTDCINYYGPHSVECLETIWLSAKCLEEGSKYPEKRDGAELVRLDELNLRQVADEFNETFIAADNGDSDNQTFCLGIAYPANCTNYYGPHSIDCLKTIWLSAKCLEEGSKYPSKRDSSDLERLDALNIREVILEFNYTFAASDSGDVANQTFCLGIVYPANCNNYYGPHSVECLETIWLSAKCLEEGSKYPEKRDGAELVRLDELDLRQVIDEFNETFIAADNGDLDNQTFCLGIVYPANCTNYYGPHSIDCLKTIWFSAKCLEEGSKYPSKRDSSDLVRLDALNIREVILEFNYTFATADNGDISNQTFCLGIVYPTDCINYYGPHSVECLETIWLSAKCLEEGSKYPEKRDETELVRLDELNLRQVIDEFNETFIAADNGDSDNQTFCLGIAYPANCTNYYGPHSIDCLKTIWFSAKCLEEGSKYPSKRYSSDLERLDALNIREVILEFNYTFAASDSGDVANQTFCLGIVYPANCNNYYGPHSVECLETIWLSAKCLEEGSKYPVKRDGAELVRLDELDLRQVIDEFNQTFIAADNGDSDNQKFCLGIVYPADCTNYYGPHSIDCLKTIWLSAKCLEDGSKYPEKRDSADLARLDALNIREMILEFNYTFATADNGDVSNQTFCLGIVYPTDCINYYGPHSVECLETIWLSAKCLKEGSRFPDKRDENELERLNELNIRQVIAEFNQTFISADNGDSDNQTFCLGIVFPVNCNNYYGPHPVSCLKTIWLSARCLPAGTKYPGKRDSLDLARLDTLNIRKVILEFNNSFSSADSGDPDNQISCLGIVYPANCTNYYGPHPVVCLETIWLNAKCLNDGTKYPEKRDLSDLSRLDERNIREVIQEFNNTFIAADDGDPLNQTFCFGMVFPGNCTNYYGPHPMNCLKTIWLSVKCLEEGSKYPEKRSFEDLDRLNTLNIREVTLEFNNTFIAAENEDTDSQTFCIGIVYPESCSNYYGPHAIECLKTIWMSVKCLQEGTKYPEKRDEIDLNRINDSNIRDVIIEFNNTFVAADNGDPDNQTFCMGMVFPANCTNYYGPHPIDCLETIWLSVKCLAQGSKYPEKRDTADLNRLDTFDIREVALEFNNTFLSADNGDPDNQTFCLGIVYPSNCSNYYGPHSIECLESIWLSAKCLKEGTMYPDKRDETDLNRLDELNIREVVTEFNDTFIAADNGDSDNQTFCLGLVFPTNCTNYYGPHSIDCLETLWLSAKCLVEGIKYPEKRNTEELSRLDTLNIREVTLEFNNTFISADNGNSENQSFCLGIVYPKNCTNYYGPHSVECLATMWLSAKCLEEGTKYPNKRDTTDLARLDELNIREIIMEFNETFFAAENGKPDNQTFCLGLVFPVNCTNYYGPHSIDCLKTMWLSANCLEEGTKYPVKRNTEDLNRLNALTIREVSMEFNNTFISADDGDPENQTFCLGIVYPANCTNYYGPHSVECLETIWLSAQCLEEGSKYPEKRDETDLDRLDELNIREIILEFNNTFIAADNGDPDNQTFCLGLVFPANCTNYYGPHSIDCLETIWLAAKCLEEGSKYPVKRNTDDLIRLDTLDIRDVTEEFNNTFISADDGDPQNQTFCLGIVYPTNCSNYYGPHSIECLETIWLLAKCLEEGSKYPEKRDEIDLNRIDELNIREVIEEFNETFIAADSGDPNNQTFCLGLVFPANCTNYYGPHSIDCLETIWLAAKCLEEGSKYPVKRNTEDLNRLDSLDIREVTKEFNTSFISADDGDQANQTFCLGIVYPTNCSNYYGPHSVECLETIWLLAKCLEEGSKYPEKRGETDLDRLDELNIREVIEEFNETFIAADNGDPDNQTFCLGLVFPANCTNYYGPHSIDCLETIWLSAKCLEEGSKYPVKRITADLNRLDTLDIREVTEEFNNTFISADDGDPENQTFCLGIVYPTNCSNYYGPHSVECLETIWLLAKCLEEGSKYPEKIGGTELNRLDELNIREVIKEFNETFIAADNGDPDNQTFCLGLVFPANCTNYYGPHSIDCLETIWLAAKCLEEGSKYPVKRNTEDLSRLNTQDIREITMEFNNTFISADDGNPENQTFCLGIVYPANCSNYYGPHSIDCLDTIWISAKCLEEGSKYPEKRDETDLNRLDELNIREVTKEFNETFIAADNGDADNQTFCLGLVFPTNCTNYYGPHSIDCLGTIWLAAKCLEEGSKYPVKRNTEDLNRLDTLNIREVTTEFNNTFISADDGDPENQNFCLGIVYPTNCSNYYGPHSVECLVTIWLSAKCLEEGTKYPDKRDETELDRLDELNIREVILEFNETFLAADHGDPDNQTFCLGLVFPANCSNYYGPHSIFCLETIWLSAKCLEEGSKYPKKRNTEDLNRLDTLDIRQVTLEFNHTFISADNGDADNQTFCLGIVYPANCTNYYGPHSVECLKTMWLTAKCLEEGSKYPEKRDDTDLDRLDELNIREIVEEFNETFIAADNGDPDNQTFCLGLVFPANCTNYYGPHSIDCLETIWLSAKCLEEGSKYPEKRDETDLDRLDILNIREITLEFNNTFVSADNGDEDNQTFCLGIVYPTDCTNYYGPHSVECLNTIWLSSRCLEEGSKYPEKRDENELDLLDELNMREVIWKFNETFNAADDGDLDNQTFCFGIVFPANCTNYYGPHTVDCLETIWLSAKCLEEGSKFPEKRNSEDLNRLDTSNIREVTLEFNNSFSAADSGDIANQTFCLGIIYPSNCTNYYGPHSVHCLGTIWFSAKCLEEGSKYPEKRDEVELDRIDDLNIREVIGEFNNTFIAADNGDPDNQTYCLGVVYPSNCTNYYGPHDVECLITIWMSVSCLPEGYKYPEKLTTDQHEDLDVMNLRNIKDLFNATFLSAESGFVTDQLNCFGMVYPSNCTNYYGPHPVKCLETIWLSAKCLKEGSKYPNKRNETDLTRLDELNIREIILEFNNSFLAADNGDSEHQSICLGLVFPTNCTNYYGPHSIECLSTIWLSARCLIEGTKYPNKLDSEYLKHLDTLDIREVTEKFNNTFLSADSGNTANQSFCLGIVYPANCTNYYGPHSIECLLTIWLSVNCLAEGSKYPSNRDAEDLHRLDQMNLREVINEFNQTFTIADAGNQSYQEYCFGYVFPLNCTNYYGPHSVECLETLWYNATCLLEGYNHPKNMTSYELDNLDKMNLREIEEEFNFTAFSANNGSIFYQEECYGMVYPMHCVEYYGPHPVECLVVIWTQEKCLSNGHEYPRKLVSEEIDVFNKMNLREVVKDFNNTHNLADGGDTAEQLACFGLVYPENCTFYYGPHSVDCLITMWVNATCLYEGYDYPTNLTINEKVELDEIDIRNVTELFNETAFSANNGNVSSQLECFGLEYPANCTDYYGPHSVDCLITMWLSINCLHKGTKFPSKLTADELDKYNQMNLREILNEYNTTFTVADSGNSSKQLECFGIVYPANCSNYYGPHSVECLETIWENATCLKEGYNYPRNLTTDERNILDEMNLKEVAELFKFYADTADQGNITNQFKCFGMKYPDNCTKYYGPNSLSCLETIWESVDCLIEGSGYPNKLEADKIEEYDDDTLREILAEFSNKKQGADSGNSSLQLYCFGIVYPANCTNYYGPHSIACLETIWGTALCLSDGYKYPENRTEDELKNLDAKNLREIGGIFNDTAKAADEGNITSQQHCFGMVYPENCTKYYGPNSVECLVTIWDSVKCLEEGTKFPEKLSQFEVEEYGTMDLRKINHNFTTIKENADNESAEMQLVCFGIVYPENCTYYYGPHSVECLETIWEIAYCLPEGFKHPLKLNESEHDYLDEQNLRQVGTLFNYTAISADNGSAVDQLNCFGMVYPLNCTKYYGPNFVECLETIWKEAECLKQGTLYPTKLSSNQFQVHSDMNIRENILNFTMLMNGSDNGNVEMQLQCFGLVYPKNCTKYYGPHSNECLITIWDIASCGEEGDKYPKNLTSDEHGTLDEMNLREVGYFFNATFASADNASKSHQLNCFGMVYPDNCTTFYGPNSVECYITIWESVECLEEGHGYPTKLPLDQISKYDMWNIREVIGNFSDVRQEADSDNDEMQLKCFGMEYPDNCTKYYGPHSVECLETIWDIATCLPEGDDYPHNRTQEELNDLDILNLRELQKAFNSTAMAADNYSVEQQLECFGMVYPDNCTKYYGPHTVDCFITIWEEDVWCLIEGTKHPSKLNITELDTNSELNLRDVESAFRFIRYKADIDKEGSYQMQCYGMLIPDLCTYHPNLTDDCLHFIWTNMTRCVEMGTAYPLTIELSTKKYLYERAHLRKALAIMADNSTDQMECYGFVFPLNCTYFPTHNMTCLEELFRQAGCDPVAGSVPHAKLNYYNESNLWDIYQHFILIHDQNYADKSNGVYAESCFKPEFIEISDGMSILIHTDMKTFNGAHEYCKSRNALMHFSIESDDIQSKLQKKLHNSNEFFGTDKWWIGLDDLENDGTFRWASNKEYDIENDYNKWDVSFTMDHNERHCASFNSENGFRWSLDNCDEVFSFICMDVTCKYRADYILPEEAPCKSSCKKHFTCVNEECVCNDMYTGENCTILKGFPASMEYEMFNKSYVFFEEQLTWKDASDYCEGIWGRLANPKTQEIHEWLVEKMMQSNYTNASAVWLGMNDTGTEGSWYFSDGERVNPPPDFSEMLKKMYDRKIPWYERNSTLVDQFYILWGDSFYGNFTEQEEFCSDLNGTLVNITSEEINYAVGKHVHDLYNIWKEKGPTSAPGNEYGNYFFALTGDENDLAIWRQADGQQVYIHENWYRKMYLPVPDKEDFAPFQKWQTWSDPNGDLDFERQHCASIQSNMNWIDQFCSRRLPAMCEFGPFPFERWHNRGRNSSEPNNAWCDEHCAGMNLNVTHPMWNDYHCIRKFPFVCEVEMPTGCTHNPPIEDGCIINLFSEAGCEEEGHGPVMDFDMFSEDTSLIVLYELNDIKELADSDMEFGLYSEACYEPEFVKVTLPSKKEVELLFHIKNKTYEEAKSIVQTKMQF